MSVDLDVALRTLSLLDQSGKPGAVEDCWRENDRHLAAFAALPPPRILRVLVDRLPQRIPAEISVLLPSGVVLWLGEVVRVEEAVWEKALALPGEVAPPERVERDDSGCLIPVIGVPADDATFGIAAVRAYFTQFCPAALDGTELVAFDGPEADAILRELRCET